MIGDNLASGAYGYEASSGKQWNQQLGATLALFDVAAAVLKASGHPNDKVAVANAMKTLQVDTPLGHLAWGKGPVDNVVATPIIGYGALVALDSVDFSVGPGEAVGVVGPNGAGKTTLLNILAGSVRPTTGTIMSKGVDVTRLSPARRCRLGIGRAHQVPRPFGAMTTFENVLVGAASGGRRQGRPAYDRSIAVLEFCGLIDSANRRAESLGLLDRKRLELARSLATDPAVLLLDEIGAGLTDCEAAALLDLIGQLRHRGHPGLPSERDPRGAGGGDVIDEPVGDRFGYSVDRWTRSSRASSAAIGILVVALALVPLIMSTNVTEQLTSLLILVLLATMWNALAGYGGLVSVGQQAFIGLGAYGTIYFTRHGVSAYPAMLLSTVGIGLVALPLSYLVLRLRGGEFAIGTWVVAEVFALMVTLDHSLGGGTGTSLTGLNRYRPSDRQAYTYWLSLGEALLFVILVFGLLRSQRDVSLRAIRDDEGAAASLGVRVTANKRLLFVIAAIGCGAAGALTLANTLFIQPRSIFGVQWAAYMIFMVLVGGLGTFEGPIIGAVVFFEIQLRFADHGARYLIGLGATAVGFALLLPRGVWGTLEERLHLRLLPLGYRVRRHPRT